MSMMGKTQDPASPREFLAWEEFIEITGISPDHLRELMSLGWLDSGSGAQDMFRDADVYRVRKLERICGDFELPVIGGVIIVDLLDRIDGLESLVAELRGLKR